MLFLCCECSGVLYCSCCNYDVLVVCNVERCHDATLAFFWLRVASLRSCGFPWVKRIRPLGSVVRKSKEMDPMRLVFHLGRLMKASGVSKEMGSSVATFSHLYDTSPWIFILGSTMRARRDSSRRMSLFLYTTCSQTQMASHVITFNENLNFKYDTGWRSSGSLFHHSELLCLCLRGFWIHASVLLTHWTKTRNQWVTFLLYKSMTSHLLLYNTNQSRFCSIVIILPSTGLVLVFTIYQDSRTIIVTETSDFISRSSFFKKPAAMFLGLACQGR